ncbi:TIGR01841 family phasin [Trinickia mobilis]|uniref:TIGR01841 family phasin n=1 Tax=Trinickia mobilis TaxID=2816356 RepID=UPI001A8D3E2C|nr:TIGR01841 family phasin [Trinickia mobilis]
MGLKRCKSTFAENQDITARAVSAKDPQEPFALLASQVQPAVEKTQSYWRHVYEIMSGSQAEFAATAEVQLKHQQYDAQAFVDSPAKNVPAGGEAVFSAWKSALQRASETASSAYGAAKEAAKRAVEITECNVNAASSASSRSTKRAVGEAEAAEKNEA